MAFALFPSIFGDWLVKNEPIYKSQGNDGKVKILGSDDPLVKPTYALVAGVERIIDYGVAALVFQASPTTEWPQNIEAPADTDIWDSVNTTLLENTVLGQKVEWRVIFSWSGKSINNVAEVKIALRNTISGFLEIANVILPEGTTAENNYSALLLTIADDNSLPAPFGTGQGYEFVFVASSNLNIVIESMTRTSHQHNVR